MLSNLNKPKQKILKKNYKRVKVLNYNYHRNHAKSTQEN